MSSYGQYVGSKAKARKRRAEEREVTRVKCELSAIAELAKGIRDEKHLREVLATVEDDDLRVATSKLIEPFLLFRIQRVEES
jgi:hypothetical protein